MKLFRTKREFVIGVTDSLSQTKIFKGQLFAVADETELPDPRDKYPPGNLKPYYEEIVPNAFLVKSFTQVAKVKEL